MLVTLVKFPGAASYQVQWAPLAAGGVPGSWTTKPAAAVRPPVLISGLIPGTTYVFQARAVTKAGYSDWSESVTRVSLCNLTPMSSPESGRGHRVQRLVSPVRWSAELRRDYHRTERDGRKKVAGAAGEHYDVEPEYQCQDDCADRTDYGHHTVQAPIKRRSR